MAPHRSRQLRPRPRDHRDAGLPRARTSGRTTRRSTSSSTSARWRTGRPTRSPASPSGCSSCCPASPNHSCSRGRKGGFVERLTRGHLARATSPSTSPCSCSRRPATTCGAARRAGTGRARAATTSSTGTSTSTSASPPAGSPSGWSTTSSRPSPTSTSTAELEQFIVRAERTAFGPSTQAILDEAVSRDIPWIRLNEYSLVQLGQGVHQKRIRATMTSNTSAIAVDVAERQGPDRPAAQRRRAAGAEARSRSARSTRRSRSPTGSATPSSCKPLDGNHGRGVCLDLQNEDDVRDGVPDRAGRSPGAAG